MVSMNRTHNIDIDLLFFFVPDGSNDFQESSICIQRKVKQRST